VAWAPHTRSPIRLIFFFWPLAAFGRLFFLNPAVLGLSDGWHDKYESGRVLSE